MKKSKFIRLLKTFSIEEIKLFYDFLASPYHNKNKKCVALMELILPFAPDFDDDRMDRQGFLDDIYTNKNSIKTLFQTMIRLFEEFLTNEGLQKQELYKKYCLLQELRIRKSYNQFTKVYRQMKRSFDLKPQKNLMDFHHRYLLATEYFQYLFIHNEVTSEDYESLWLHMDQSYVLSRLKYTSSMLNKQRIKSAPMNIPSADTMLRLAEEQRLSNNTPLVEIYKTAYQLILHNEDRYFHTLIELLENNLSNITKEEANEFYTAAINFCIRKHVEGKLGYYHHVFKIYQICLEERIFFVNKVITPQRLHNLVVIGSHTKNFEWVENFLEENKQNIEAKFRAFVYHYNKGMLYYYQGKLSESSDALIEASFEGTPKNMAKNTFIKRYNINIQVLLLRIYYEQKEVFAFDSLVKSFLERIRLVKDINQQEKKAYQHFAAIVKLLFRKKTDPNFKTSLESIKNKLHSYSNIGNKQWLLTKIDELEK